MRDFWRAALIRALIRALKTVCQTAVAVIGSAVVLSDVDWKVVASAAALSGILSLLTSVSTGLPEVDLADDLLEEDDDSTELEEWGGFEDDMDVEPYEGDESGEVEED